MARSRLPRFFTPKIILVFVSLGSLAGLSILGDLASPAWSQITSAGPSLVVAADAVTAAGMTPGGDIVWLAMLRKVVEYEAVYLRRQGVMQADAQGVAQLPVAEAVPPQSLWIAIDLKTGAYAMASPAGFSPLLFDLVPEALNVRGDALADQLVDVADHAEILLVRPGKGAWGKGVGRGGADDDSSPNDAAYKLSLDKLEPLRGADGPSTGKLNARDLLFVLHPEAMAVAVVTFRGKP
jgi:hypothetical protein